MKNKELLRFQRGLVAVSKLPGVKFAYAVARNQGKIKSEIEALQESSKPSEDHKKFNTERIELCEKHSEKDENGVAMQNEDGTKYIINDEAAFEKVHVKLTKKHKIAIDARNKQLKGFEDILNEEIEIEFHQVKEVDFPEGITTEQMINIREMMEGL